MSSEETAGGALGRIAGKAKEVAGSALGNDELAREGRLQQAGVDAEREARDEAAEARQAQEQADLQAAKDETKHEREELQAEQAQVERERAIERDRARAESEAAAEQAQQERAADAQRGAGEVAAELKQEQADRERAAAAAEAVRLEQEARRAEVRADAVDPEASR
jgi:uncharacterized protein YjbJ (UPF0337 family)